MSDFILNTIDKKDKKAYTTLMRKDKEFALAIEKAEQSWLENANSVLSELLAEIRERITSPETSMKELVTAIDVLSNKWNLYMGKPTSLDASVKINVTKEIKDEELDERLKELERHFILAPLPHNELPQDMGLGNPPLISKPFLGEVQTIEGELEDE
jgi:hypothetical protein